MLLMHRLILPTPRGYQVDHRNGNGLDNRRSNLRIATVSQNQMNSRLRSDSTSGFRGVSWESQTGKWRARIRAGGRDISLGRFASKEAAVRAYVDAANELHAEFAYQSDPEQPISIPFGVYRVSREITRAEAARREDEGEAVAELVTLTLRRDGDVLVIEAVA